MTDELNADATERLIDRLTRLDALGESIERLRVEAAQLRASVAARPDRRELDYKRRLTSWLLVAYGVLIIFVHDQHIEMCGPGSRAGGRDTNPICDLTFPLHGHNSAYPNAESWVGLALYALLIAASWYWVRAPLRRKTDERD